MPSAPDATNNSHCYSVLLYYPRVRLFRHAHAHAQDLHGILEPEGTGGDTGGSALLLVSTGARMLRLRRAQFTALLRGDGGGGVGVESGGVGVSGATGTAAATAARDHALHIALKHR